ncbi:glycosyltransferase family 2 protein [Paenibacillus sp. 32352]|uniref:glycosyltransferase family 2 protein n=1 Tax=Paenibacillus sp. 32352 TaxID=1969111 RepID=UPI0009AE5DFF|nr:glycosyltransferase family 2 protein [Paenibacillus sp. 32352]
MIEPKISIVVPAWNAEPYLERCLKSIARQTFTDFEVILVDAGSTDKTAEIAQLFVGKDKRFHYYKNVFAPPGIGRNFGLEKAHSPYIAFVDSDDTLEPNMLEFMYSAAITENADITVCDLNMVYPQRVVSSFSRLTAGSFVLSNESLADYYFRFNAAPKPNNYVWSRLYRKEFIQKTGVRFADTLYSEDHLFNLMLSSYMPRITHVGKALYNYIQRDDSAVRQSASNTNHGNIFYSVFESARAYLETLNGSFVTPILSIYAFTRIRSIVFYGQLASLPEDKLQESIMSFLLGEKVEYYLSLCEKNGYLRDYCRIHNISAEQEQLFHELLSLCLEKEKITLDKGWFA